MGDDPQRWQRLQDMFVDALALRTAERPEFLGRVCGADAALRGEVEAMLAVSSPEHALEIEDLVSDAGPPDSPPTLLIGARMGSWRVVDIVGRGGMSTVYLAERADGQYEQRVALKIVGPGAPDVKARQFTAERHILARLSHPNIARLFDAGVAPEGSAYLVMEYVDGVPLTTYCDARQLRVEERLRLFHVVCEATQHAHQALVVHRDLKPSNIFVSHAGDVKLLDFGIAELLEPETSAAKPTGRELFLTPAYAAPEQVRGDPVTTATDVYALGVVLHELLIGQRPFDSSSTNPHDLQPALLSDTPSPPSGAVRYAVSSCSPEGRGAIGDVARARRTTPAKLARQCRGDLDHIVLKALRPEPGRRYASAGQFAEDIDRFLVGRPVIARPDTWAYRASRFVVRHRAAVAVAGLLVVLLAAFSATTALQARRVGTERDRARSEQQKAEQVMRLFVDLFKTANPEIAPGGDRQSIGEFLAHAESRVLGQTESQPELTAALRHVLGLVHFARNSNARARQLLDASLAEQRRLFGEDAIETLTVQVDLGELLAWLDERDRAVALLEDALVRIRRGYGDDHLLAARSYAGLASVQPTLNLSQEYLERAVAICRARLPSTDADRIKHTTALAVVYTRRSLNAEARTLFDEALSGAEALNGGRTTALINVLNDSAALDLQLGDYARAEQKHRRNLALAEDLLGPDSFQVANSLNDLAVALANQGRIREAASAFQQAYDRHVVIFGDAHWRTVNALRNVGMALLLLGQSGDAATVMRRALRLSEASSGRDTSGTVYMRAQLARCLIAQRHFDEAIALLKAAVDRLQAIGGDAQTYLANARLWLGRALLESGRPDMAAPYVVAAMEQIRRTERRDDPVWTEAECELAHVRTAQGRRTEALALAETCVPRLVNAGLVEPWRKHSAERLLARLRDQGSGERR